MSRSHLPLALLLLCAGCMVGPDFAPPPAATPAAFALPAAEAPARTSTLTDAAADVARWWQQLAEPKLSELIERAVAANLDLQAAEARIRQARAARAVVAGGLWPAVAVTASAQRLRAEGPGGGGSRSLFQTGLDASWELDVFGGTRRAVEAADADLQASIEDRRDLMVTLCGEVALDYVDLRGLQEQLRIANSNLAAQERTLDITRRRFAGGLTNRLDVANAEAQVANTRSSIPSLQADVQRDVYLLSVLLGQEPMALAQELSAPAPIPAVPATVPVGLPSDLLRRRPDLRRGEAALHAAVARIGVATADLYPHFSLTALVSWQGGKLPGLLDVAQRTASAGGAVSWPLFAGGAIEANIALRQAVADETLLAWQQTVLTALRDVQVALAANRQSVDLSTRLYTAGQTDFLSVLVAQRALFSAEDAFAQSQRQLTTDLIALYKALGGGWEWAAGDEGGAAAPAADAPAR
jgi:NodT family efflux transporter outer membrane factor (OMF) lipoprotein